MSRTHPWMSARRVRCGGRRGPAGGRPRPWRLARLAALALAALAGCEDPTETPLVDQALTEIDADLVYYGMSHFLTQEGVRNGEVRADSAYAFRDSTVAHLYGVDMTVFTEQGLERARVLADSGRLNQRTQEMVAWGEVRVTLPEGDRRIETTELHYDPSSDRIWSDSMTTFREAGKVTQGSCFRSDLQFRNRTICNIRGAADIGQPVRPDTTDGGGERP